jgi:hypothetical protein
VKRISQSSTVKAGTHAVQVWPMQSLMKFRVKQPGLFLRFKNIFKKFLFFFIFFASNNFFLIFLDYFDMLILKIIFFLKKILF